MNSMNGQYGRFLVIAAFVAVLLSVSDKASAACSDPLGECTDPCPARNSCVFDSHCNAGSVCSSDVPCAPGACFCANGLWVCTPNCNNQCVELEAVEVPVASPVGLLGLALALSVASMAILAKRRRRSGG